MSSLLQTIKNLVGLASDREARWMLAVSATGWLYYAHQYLFDSGLAVAIPRYAGY